MIRLILGTLNKHFIVGLPETQPVLLIFEMKFWNQAVMINDTSHVNDGTLTYIDINLH